MADYNPKAEREKDFRSAAAKETQLRNEIIGNIKQGDNFNPWLSIQRSLQSHLMDVNNSAPQYKGPDNSELVSPQDIQFEKEKQDAMKYYQMMEQLRQKP